VLITFITICLASYAKANVLSNLVDDGLYSAINAIIDVKYREKPVEERDCIKKKLKDDRFADKLSSSNLKFDHGKLQNELNNFDSDLKDTALFCEWFEFLKTPLGICIIVGIILMLLSIIIGICKCICC
jgi:hypothetical protein